MIRYKRADMQDIPFLIKNRLELLQSANRMNDSKKLKPVEEQLKLYYDKMITSEKHIEYLAYYGDSCVGSGGICFYQVLPTYHNPTGWKAYIANMYTKPEFRKQGIASHILDCLVKESLQAGVNFISLEATESGRPIYEKYGFVTLRSEMQLKNEAYDENQNSSKPERENGLLE